MAKTYFFWDGDNLLQEHDQAGATVAHYVTEPEQYGKVISQRRDGQTHVFHYDAVGSTMELTDQSGAVTDSLRSTAFGETTAETGTTTYPFRFVGQLGYYLDSADARYAIRRRRYDTWFANWLSADPLPGAGPNLYSYVNNSPVSFVDPSGLALPPRPFAYGYFCGPNRVARCVIGPAGTYVPAGVPTNPAPIDLLDGACAIHDCCLKEAKDVVCELLGLKTCNAAFCASLALIICEAMHPDDSLASYQCNQMKQTARNAFC